MKKIKILLVALILSTTSFAIVFTGAFDYSNWLANFKTQLETVKSVKNQMEQIKNQVKSVQNEYESLRNQAKNLKQLDMSLSDRNIRILENSLNEIQNLGTYAKSFIYDNEEMVDKFWDVYKEDPEKFTEITGFDEQGLAGIKKDVAKAKKASRYAVYDAMTNAGMTATIGNDEENIKKLLKASQTADGALQAIQATNNLVGNSNSILLQIRTLLETNIKMSGSMAMAGDTTKSAEEKTKEKAVTDFETGEKKGEDYLNETLKNLSKKPDWGFKFKNEDGGK